MLFLRVKTCGIFLGNNENIPGNIGSIGNLHLQAAKRQTTIQGITEGHLETTEGERGDGNILRSYITAASFRAMLDSSHTNSTASMDSTESNQRPQDAANQDALVLRGIEVIFDYCRFCGELKDCTDARNDPKPYLANNKCTLIINDLRAELNFTDNLARNICKDCAGKFQEMLDFVKRVKDAQVKFNNFNNDTLDLNQKKYYKESEKEADGQRKKCRITIDFNSDILPSLSDNDDETNDVEMNSDDDDASQKVIDPESEIDKSRVSINKSPPSSSLCKEHVNSTMSYHHRADTPTNFITTYTEFLKTSSLSEKIYNSRPLSYMMMHHKSAEDVCEDDVNSIDIKKEHETADDVNDKQEQINTDDNIYDDIDIKEEDIKAAIDDAARKKAQLENNCYVSNR